MILWDLEGGGGARNERPNPEARVDTAERSELDIRERIRTGVEDNLETIINELGVLRTALESFFEGFVDTSNALNTFLFNLNTYLDVVWVNIDWISIYLVPFISTLMETLYNQLEHIERGLREWEDVLHRVPIYWYIISLSFYPDLNAELERSLNNFSNIATRVQNIIFRWRSEVLQRSMEILSRIRKKKID